MIREACELRAAAREALTGKWGSAVVVTLVYGIISGLFNLSTDIDTFGIGMLFLFLFFVAVYPPMKWGFEVIFLDKLRTGERYDIKSLFCGFENYGRVWVTLLLKDFYILMWAIMLIVPGIIKSFSYAMTPYILRDNPSVDGDEAIELSMDMMDGHKFDLFYLYLTFIGWWILACLSCGIGFLWLIPYMQSAVANFYEDVKVEYESKIMQ